MLLSMWTAHSNPIYSITIPRGDYGLSAPNLRFRVAPNIKLSKKAKLLIGAHPALSKSLNPNPNPNVYPPLQLLP